MSLLGKAIALAATAHEGQVDRYGAPYILHPLRVMARVESEPEQIAAALHDVVEDTDWTLGRLRAEGFPEEVVRAVDALTRRDGEPYDQAIERAAQDPIARRVKRADLEDNMDLRRMPELTDEGVERLRQYHRAWRRLGGAAG